MNKLFRRESQSDSTDTNKGGIHTSFLRMFRPMFLIPLIVAVILVSTFLTLRVQYETIASNLSLVEIIPMQNALNEAGIRNRVTNNGTTLQVDNRQTQDAVIVIVVQQSTLFD